MKNLEHETLTGVVRAFAPAISEGGVCEGVTSMWAQAVLTNKNEENKFYDRLDFLSVQVQNLVDSEMKEKDESQAYLNRAEELQAEIDDIYDSKKAYSFLRKLSETEGWSEEQRSKLSNKEELNKDELQKTEVRAFAEAVAVQQSPSDLGISNEKTEISQLDKKILFPLTVSQKLSEKIDLKIKCDIVSTLALTETRLMHYFEGIKKILTDDNVFCGANSERRDAFLLGSEDHTVGVYFDNSSNRWHFFDVNKLSGKEKYYASVTSGELAKHILESFSDDKQGNTIFSISYLSSGNRRHEVLVGDLLENTWQYQDAECMGKGNGRGFNLLQLSAKVGDKSSVETLLSIANFDVNIMHTGWTALMYAAANGDTDIVKALLSAPKIDVNRTNNGMTALMFASQNGHTDIVKILRAVMPKPNVKPTLTAAILSSDIEMVKTFLVADPKLDINKTDIMGRTALIYATTKGHADIVKVLLATTPEPDMTNLQKAIGLAILSGKTDTVQAFLDFNLKLTEGIVAKELTAAVTIGDAKKVKHLLAVPGIDQIQVDSLFKDLLTDVIFLASKKTSVDVVKAFLAHFPVKDRASKFEFVLSSSVRNHNVGMVYDLLATTPESDLKVVERALKHARYVRCTAIADLLETEISKRRATAGILPSVFFGDAAMVADLLAIPNLDRDVVERALKLAIQENYPKVINVFLTAYPKLSKDIVLAKLRSAARSGDTAIVKTLLAADPEVGIDTVKKALQIAIQRDYADVVKVLRVAESEKIHRVLEFENNPLRQNVTQGSVSIHIPNAVIPPSVNPTELPAKTFLLTPKEQPSATEARESKDTSDQGNHFLGGHRS